MRRRVVVVLAVCGLALAGWGAAWSWIASGIEARFTQWVEARRLEGLRVEYRALAVSGFPLAWRIAVDGPAMAGAGPTAWEWRGQSLTAEFIPWAMGEAPFELAGEHVVSVGAGGMRESFRLRAQRSQGRAVVGAEGKLVALHLDLGDLDLARSPAGAITKVRRATLGLRLHRPATPTHDTETLEATVAIAEAVMATTPLPSLGEKIERAELDASFKGALPKGKLASALAAWRQDGGTIEINRVAVVWGALELEASGTLALDERNRPLGAFAARLKGYGEAVDAMAAARLMRPVEAAALKIGLNLVARQGSPDGGKPLAIPVTAQDGRLSVAGFPLLRLEPLRLE
ncbi:MAG: DUF2125 domain-containing protein [Pseudomonadota bacterium]